MDPNTLKALQGAAGAAGGGGTKYVEEVFSTYLYMGTGAAQTINNGIDLDGEGGLVWIKRRTGLDPHNLYDTERGTGSILKSDRDGDEDTTSNGLTAFNSNGFTLGTDGDGHGSNPVDEDMVSWTFRKAPGFFDVVEYTGNGTSGREVPHSLGCKPGCIIVKKTDGDEDWAVYHKNLAGGSLAYLTLNEGDGETNDVTVWNYSAPQATYFKVGDGNTTNEDGKTYIAYVFADGSESDAQIFGDDEDESIIKMGTFSTGSGETSGTITGLGWEPQLVLYKCISQSGPWRMHDNMRNLAHNGYADLRLNTTDAEASHGTLPVISATPDGFEHQNTNSSRDFVYIVIRRGPMKTPEAGTEVFSANTDTSPTTAANRPEMVDMMWFARRGGWAENIQIADRMRGFENVTSLGDDNSASAWLITNDTDQEATSGGAIYQYSNSASGPHVTAASGGSNFMHWFFKRAPGFFDIVKYSGTGSATTHNHNLGVIPEMMFVKTTSGSSENWLVYHSALGGTKRMILNSGTEVATSSLYWNDTAPTSTVFSTAGYDGSNGSPQTYINYLFASCPDVSKVGSYTGTGNDIDVDCGFTAGARLVIAKRTDDLGDWYIWDSTRGIVSGDDPLLVLNTDDAEITNTDYIDPLTTGFTITSSAPDALNVSGGEYIYLAIA